MSGVRVGGYLAHRLPDSSIALDRLGEAQHAYITYSADEWRDFISTGTPPTFCQDLSRHEWEILTLCLR